MKNVFILILFFSFAREAFSQSSPNKSFALIDRHALNLVNSNLAFDSLCVLLFEPCKTELEKTRVIYRWITAAVDYDTELYARFKNDRVAYSRDVNSLQESLKIYRERIAVCQGYSNLFLSFCKKANLTCFVVNGYGKPLENNSPELHSWNVVLIDSAWRLTDATWGAGGINEKGKFQKVYSDDFFIASPEEFIKTHYPHDPMWQLKLKPVRKSDFEKNKLVTGDTREFYFNDTIQNWMMKDSTEREFESYSRAVKLNPDDKLAADILDVIKNNKSFVIMNSGADLIDKSAENFNNYIEIVNRAKIKRQPNMISENEKKLYALLDSAKVNAKDALQVFEKVSFSDNNRRLLEKNIAVANQNLKMIGEQYKYLARFFNTPKLSRIKAL